MIQKKKVIYTILIIFMIITGGPLNPVNIIILLMFYGDYRGRKKAKRKFLKEIKKIKVENPHIYFREIPNNYGIGVSGLLLDFDLDQNDLIGAILDLSAKKYIKVEEKLESFEIVQVSNDYNNLLDNEMFILNWILSNQNNELKYFNYKEWKNLVKQDALNIGLIKNRNIDNNKTLNTMFKYNKILKRTLSLIFIIIFGIITTVAFNNFLSNTGIRITDIFKNPTLLFSSLIPLIISVFIGGFISGIIVLILSLISSLFHGFISSKSLSYNKEMSNMPIITDLGIKEIQELYALGSFLKDFGRFSDKHLEEIVIWEQYFSYAQLFELTKYLLNTNHKKLVNNHCFKIKSTSKIKKIIVKQMLDTNVI